jgi:hypothetical protein
MIRCFLNRSLKILAVCLVPLLVGCRPSPGPSFKSKWRARTETNPAQKAILTSPGHGSRSTEERGVIGFGWGKRLISSGRSSRADIKIAHKR